MLFPSKDLLKEFKKQMKQGDLTVAARRMLELDSHCAPAYMTLGYAAAEAGRIQEAEKYFWGGMAEQPCSFQYYFALAELRCQQDPGDELMLDLVRLVMRKLARAKAVLPDVASALNRGLGAGLGLDFSHPETFAQVAATFESRAREGPADARLHPYLCLDRLQEQIEEGALDEDLLGEIRRRAAEMAPVLESALREWAHDHDAIGMEALCLAVALLGEIAPVEALDNLLDASTFDDHLLFLHSQWAIWRMGQRFPDAALAQFRARIPGAPVTLRCGIAEQLGQLPRNPQIPFAAHLLVEGFAKIAREDDADYLLLATADALETHGCDGEARALIARFRGLLPKEGRSLVDELRRDGFEPRLVFEEIPELDIEDVCLRRIFLDDEDDEDEEDEEDDFEEEAPPLVMSTPAPPPDRNEPCWCGSGRKYKKCHLAADEEAKRGSAKAGLPLHERLFAELMRAAELWDPGMVQVKKAARMFFGGALTREALEQDDGFGQWYICDFRPREGAETTVERYLREYAAKLDARERAMLESFRDGRFGAYQVQRVEPGRGIELKDLFGSSGAMFVEDLKSSGSLDQWDCLLCRVEFFEGKWVLGGDGMRVPPPLLGEFRAQVAREAGRAGLSEEEWVGANGHKLHTMVRQLVAAHNTTPMMRSFEGDAFEFCKATYRVLDEGAAVAGLLRSDEFEALDDGAGPGPRSIAWLEAGGGDVRRSFGTVEISEGQLRLECHSQQRLERGRRLIEKHAGAWLEHLGDTVKGIDDAMNQRAAIAGAAQNIPPEIAQQAIAQYLERHYATWPDHPLPALGGRTPRDAARTAAGRREVAALIHTMESSDRRGGGAAPFDFSKLRAQLGLGAEE